MEEIFLPVGDLESLQDSTAAIGRDAESAASRLALPQVAAAMPGSAAAPNAADTADALRVATTHLTQEYTEFSNKVLIAIDSFAQAEDKMVATYQQLAGQRALDSATIGILSPQFPTEE
ncbi:hypothetical protein [Buchananella hordeovulneris]|uniref:PE domain-containing protein n=1 Tax=Buchananella hordeovulneris TaxID=52770 RepID=A0A1Q5PVY9_9ACTO|nr:hypothetical protein [Buchananella hordeovulneris]OKL51609.1 hypothetical protein BSZ40_07175 [Buchananella hordeovulneris]